MTLCTIVGMGLGIGLSVAKKFVSEGFDIAMISRNETHLENYVKILSEYGTKLSYSVADAGKKYRLLNALDRIAYGTDVLVYNAAVVEKSSFLDTDEERLSNDFNVNVIGALIAAKSVIPLMKKRKKGTILFTGGGFAHEPNPNYLSLSIGKAALLNLGMNLALEYEPLGIHTAVVSIYGKVELGTKYNPKIIADKFWEIHNQPKDKWDREVHIK